jgi:hypothetical protein
VARRSHDLIGLLAAGSMYAFHCNGRRARLLRDEPVLLFDDGARRGVAIEAAEDFAWHSAIGALRTVFVNHVEKSEFNSRRRLSCHFSCHFLGPVIAQRGFRPHRGRHHGHRRTSAPNRPYPGAGLHVPLRNRRDVLKARSGELAALTTSKVSSIRVCDLRDIAQPLRPT